MGLWGRFKLVVGWGGGGAGGVVLSRSGTVGGSPKETEEKKQAKYGFKRIRRGKKTLTNCSAVRSVLLPMPPLPPSTSNPNGLVELKIQKIFVV